MCFTVGNECHQLGTFLSANYHLMVETLKSLLLLLSPRLLHLLCQGRVDGCDEEKTESLQPPPDIAVFQ